MVRSSKRSGHSPFKAVMLGSSPARITITMGYSQVAKAPVFDTGIVGSSPAIPAMIRYSSGSRGQTANLLIAGSNPARISIWCLRLMDRTLASQAGNAGSIPAGITITSILGCSQVVRQRSLTPSFAGSNPAAPANMESEPDGIGDRPLSGLYWKQYQIQVLRSPPYVNIAQLDSAAAF